MNNTDHAKTLYQTVPAVYRNRDNGDLKKFFLGTSILLDQLHATLQQRLADNFPDNSDDQSAACQDWLIPYFADLLDVRLVSPSIKGRREEVSNAVRWRQGKGTLRVCEEIAQAVGQLETVLHEGWQRVAKTPHLLAPKIPAQVFGFSQAVPTQPASIAARHPGLSAVTPNFACPSGAIASSSSNPAAQQSKVDGQNKVWRQLSRHGSPCHPGSFEDVSRRTVDFRNGDWQHGHYHPNRLLLYTVPPAGFFHLRVKTVNWSSTPSDAFLQLIDVITQGNKTIYRNKTFGSENFVPVRIRLSINLGQEPDGVGSADFHTWRFEGLILENTLQADSGRIELEQCAGRKIEVHSIDYEKPVISAHACLFKSLQAARGLAQLEYCTVLETSLIEIVNASDCIFLGLIKKDHLSDQPPLKGCLRFSRVSRIQNKGGMSYTQVNRARIEMFEQTFGKRSCGVLHPACSQSVSRGAQDNTEMGAYHNEFYSLLADAVVDKLNDYLPVGTNAVVIPDKRLLEIAD
jgi:hypothetical protein